MKNFAKVRSCLGGLFRGSFELLKVKSSFWTCLDKISKMILSFKSSSKRSQFHLNSFKRASEKTREAVLEVLMKLSYFHLYPQINESENLNSKHLLSFYFPEALRPLSLISLSFVIFFYSTPSSGINETLRFTKILQSQREPSTSNPNM